MLIENVVCKMPTTLSRPQCMKAVLLTWEKCLYYVHESKIVPRNSDLIENKDSEVLTFVYIIDISL